MPRSDLPFGSEFSPQVIRLPHLLHLAADHGGDWRAFEAAAKDAYFRDGDADETQKAKKANNTKLSMQAYGIIDRDARLTDFGDTLHAVKDDPDSLHEELARHILLNLHGMNLVQCIQDMHAAGEEIDLVKLRYWLEERGIHFPRGGKHPSIMRLWLAMAGLFPIRGEIYRLDEARLHTILGATVEDFDALAMLTPEQRAFLKTMVNMGGVGPWLSNDLEAAASATFGVRFNEKSVPQQVLYPLQRAGFIELARGTRAPGRGAKPFAVTPTERFQAEILMPLVEQIEAQVAADIRPLLRRPLATILEEVQSEDRYIGGLALEALAFKLMRMLDLTYVGTRLRGSQTGGAEVDLIFESARLAFTRWQVQCKRTDRVSLEDVAKEVGLSNMLKTSVIVIVTTGRVGSEARRFANKVMSDSNLCVVLVEGADLGAIQANAVTIIDVFNRQARHAMSQKPLEL